MSENTESYSCLTPGCLYSIRTFSHHQVSTYGPPRIEIVVRFPDNGHHLLVAGNRQIIHDHLERAVAEIGRLDRAAGGELTRGWPDPKGHTK